MKVSENPCTLWRLQGRILSCFPSFSKVLVVFWLVGASLQCLPLSSQCLLDCIFLSIRISLFAITKTSIIEIRATLNQCDLNWLHLQKSDFQIRSHSEVLGGHEFWKDVTKFTPHSIFEIIACDHLNILSLSWDCKLWGDKDHERDFHYFISRPTMILTQI